MSEPACVAVDWGTSSLRLWLVSGTGDVLAERRSHQGMAALRKDDFGEVLESHLEALAAPGGLPVVVCGMAGARQGWVEAGYVDAPANLSFIPRRAVPVPRASRDALIALAVVTW